MEIVEMQVEKMKLWNEEVICCVEWNEKPKWYLKGKKCSLYEKKFTCNQMQAHTNTHTHIHTHTDTHTHTHMHRYMHLCTHTHTHMHTNSHTHTHTCTHPYTHTHTHTNTHLFSKLCILVKSFLKYTHTHVIVYSTMSLMFTSVQKRHLRISAAAFHHCWVLLWYHQGCSETDQALAGLSSCCQ